MNNGREIIKVLKEDIGDHGFESCRGLKFYFVPQSCHNKLFIFLHVEVVDWGMRRRNRVFVWNVPIPN